VNVKVNKTFTFADSARISIIDSGTRGAGNGMTTHRIACDAANRSANGRWRDKVKPISSVRGNWHDHG
jgi:hypothetical protein